MDLRHPPVVQVLPTPHRVGEVNPPAVALVHVPHRGGGASLRHDRVRLPEEGLGDDPDPHTPARRLDGRPQARPPGADHEDVVLVGPVVGHQKILRSVQTPIAHIRT